ncbi:hypothetical protein [Streptomyces rishiriensis]|uniref:hypothetical protein n=1 Tax=Streptomyces rishiriensis TaxID=68264 RepID=UPI00131F1F49|nr:hypothetical protein [Streptomyces rishiriensis]
MSEVQVSGCVLDRVRAPKVRWVADLRFSWFPQAWTVLLDLFSEVREVEHAAFGECL